MEIRETFAAWKARLLEANPNISFALHYRGGDLVSASAYTPDDILEQWPTTSEQEAA